MRSTLVRQRHKIESRFARKDANSPKFQRDFQWENVKNSSFHSTVSFDTRSMFGSRDFDFKVFALEEFRAYRDNDGGKWFVVDVARAITI
jgi:hypothetical protein